MGKPAGGKDVGVGVRVKVEGKVEVGGKSPQPGWVGATLGQKLGLGVGVGVALY